MSKPKFTMRKYMGDDKLSWAVFKDGRAYITGLSRNMASYYKKQEEAKYDAPIQRKPHARATEIHKDKTKYDRKRKDRS